jgi:quinol monooxygenase YgiN
MMKAKLICLSIIVFMSIINIDQTAAQDKKLVVRVARLQIDSTQLENYKAALKEEIDASISIEPGVLNLYAVADKEHPNHITIFEIYANVAAYKAHLETPHFKKYKTYTKDMVQSLTLSDTEPIVLGAKPH